MYLYLYTLLGYGYCLQGVRHGTLLRQQGQLYSGGHK